MNELMSTLAIEEIDDIKALNSVEFIGFSLPRLNYLVLIKRVYCYERDSRDVKEIGRLVDPDDIIFYFLLLFPLNPLRYVSDRCYPASSCSSQSFAFRLGSGALTKSFILTSDFDVLPLCVLLWRYSTLFKTLSSLLPFQSVCH